MIKSWIVEHLKNEDGSWNLIGKIIIVLIIFIVIRVFSYLVKKFLDKLIHRTRRKDYKYIDLKKTETLFSVMISAINSILFFIWAIISLNTFGINTSGILKAAGIGGLAIGFGAKALVEDIISGFFLIFENQYSIGDYVNLKNKDGIVIDIALRTTTIQDFSGERHIIPNGEIRIVTNKSRNDQRAMVNFSVSYESSVEKAIEVLETALKKELTNDENIVEGPDVIGVTNLGDSSVVICAVARCHPMQQWQIERKMRIIGKNALDEHNIEIPYNKLDVKIIGE